MNVLQNVCLKNHQNCLQTTRYIEGGNPLPAVDLSGLDNNQRIEAETMLREEHASFSTSGKDIGCLPDLEMEINLTDYQPVQKNYILVHRPLYPEVKLH